MDFYITKEEVVKSLNLTLGVVEKRQTLPILSNVLLEAKDANLKITATDLDLIFIQNISNIEINASLIGELVMDKLRSIDKVAFIRFASVYKNFKEAKDFEEFVGNINENKS